MRNRQKQESLIALLNSARDDLAGFLRFIQSFDVIGSKKKPSEERGIRIAVNFLPKDLIGAVVIRGTPLRNSLRV